MAKRFTLRRKYTPQPPPPNKGVDVFIEHVVQTDEQNNRALFDMIMAATTAAPIPYAPEPVWPATASSLRARFPFEPFGEYPGEPEYLEHHELGQVTHRVVINQPMIQGRPWPMPEMSMEILYPDRVFVRRVLQRSLAAIEQDGWGATTSACMDESNDSVVGYANYRGVAAHILIWAADLISDDDVDELDMLSALPDGQDAIMQLIAQTGNEESALRRYRRHIAEALIVHLS